MGRDDWMQVIDDATMLGVRTIQFIGGEPTLHPALLQFVDHALYRGMQVEVFTNLLRVTRHMWETFGRPGVRLATSYYADDASQHEAITTRRGSYQRTRANIVEAVRRSIPLRVGLIDVAEGQRVEEARKELMDMGVTEVDTDRLRQVGRGVRDQEPDASQLCGACARGKVAVAANGDVWPCVFARWMPIGNVRAAPLSEIAIESTLARCQELINSSAHLGKCEPRSKCDPAKSDCQPHCPPGYHSDPKKCWPYYDKR